MTITRSGPPRTHDRVTWRVPLSGPPSIEWQETFRKADGATSIATPGGVRFEEVALTFRSEDDDVPLWIEHIDRWIAQTNVAQTARDDERRRGSARTQQRSDAQRQQVIAANEKFKNL
jgi:hypothetical protein